MSSSPPTTLGKYQIIREIARSNDIVYEAYDQQMNRRVAVKELAFPTGLSETQKHDRIGRFKREARAAGSLAHPNIMTVYEVGEDGDRHFIAMEYLDGVTLRNEVDTKGFLESNRAVEIAISVLRGLELAHMSGVIHRDIKPDNIQILSDGRIKITDFGIARLTFEPNLTMDGQVFGTPSYMSPEQVVGKEIDARSDIFSVGIVLYEMLSGQKPFQGDSVVSITFAIMNKEPDRPAQIPFSIWSVIAKALDKSPALRYASAAEMITDLENALRNPNAYTMDPYANQQNSTGGYPAGSLGPGNMGNFANLPPVAFQPPPGAQPGYLPPQGAPPAGFPVPQVYNQQSYGQPTQMPIMPSTMAPPPGFIPQPPTYYPPPPRKPMLSPEARYTLGRIFYSVILLGILFMLIFFVIQGISTAVSNSRNANSAAARTARNESLPIDDRIAAGEAYTQTVTSEAQKAAAREQLSDLYRQKGDSEGKAKDNGAAAENSYRMAVDNNPNSPAPYYSLAKQIKARAITLSEPADRARVYAEVVSNYQTGLRFEANSEARRKYQNELAEAMYEQAVAYKEASNRFDARDRLYSARRIVDNDPELLAKIDSLLRELS